MLSARERGRGWAGRGAAPRGSLAEGNLIFMKWSCLNPKSSAPVTRSCVTLRSHGNCCYFQDPSLAEWHKSSFPFSRLSTTPFSRLSFWFFFLGVVPPAFVSRSPAAGGAQGSVWGCRGRCPDPGWAGAASPAPLSRPGSGSSRCSP